MKHSMIPSDVYQTWRLWFDGNVNNSLFVFIHSHLNAYYTDKCACDRPKISDVGQMLKQCDDPDWVYRCPHCLAVHIYTELSYLAPVKRSLFVEFIHHINESRGTLFSRCICGINLNAVIDAHYGMCNCNQIYTTISDLCGGCTFNVMLKYNWPTLISMSSILSISEKKIGLPVV